MPYHKESFLAGVAVGRNMKSWPLMESTPGIDFSFTIDTTLGNNITTYSFWLKKSPFHDVLIDWGDDTSGYATNNVNSHSYQTAGEYTITLKGPFEQINFSVSSTGEDESDSLIIVHTPLTISKEHGTHMISLDSMFSGCRNLRKIPRGLFKNYYKNGYSITGTQYLFTNCKSLKKIPDDLFDWMVFPSDKEFGSVFNGSGLEEIPLGLFASPEFSKIKRTYMLFAGTNITEIPVGLFDKFTNCISFESVFQGCSFLETIPGGLFDSCAAVKSFRFSFLRCESLQSLPSGLFSIHESVSDFTGAFQDCSSLEQVPSNLFNLSMDTTPYFNSCFRNDRAITSAVPELWNYYPDSSHSGCYLNCSRASNYASIPSDWK